ncbi:pyridoxamine 5'-phosphate oxidase [Prosthecomicrobium pneumaticum]|uniref:Pyridoxine/pyridoxamine 5'-phosphate oxidase n=1 Tax=Prosthecomicrobium pneumaticum TaxID=81895 RepID=A0A7W9FM06_9HYPH|nr:pyridoxamine 5'-phosphate oxidase [Prosthecomicrobium pneumaticum]MBB5753132.1 pyridoxamine 5'-phosphate oxidase [Prosthecomicrobium pneumaticum]
MTETLPFAPALDAAFRPGEPLVEQDDPFALFARWMALAEASEPEDANAMALATVDAEGLPNVRMVLLKSAGPEGFVFFTNTGSQKGRELAAGMRCAAVLHWKSLRRQVRFRGPAAFVDEAEADAYFASRSRESRIGAWASRQSRPIPDRAALAQAVAETAARFGDGPIPRPPHWAGYRVAPTTIEFWINKPFRLHDRVVFRRADAATPWTHERLSP